MRKYRKKMAVNLVIPNFRRNFANANSKNCNNASCFLKKSGLWLSWLEYASGGREVAGSSPVTPT